MLEFKENRYGILTAKAGKWGFQINKSRRIDAAATPFWVVAVRSTKKDVKRLDTGTHQRFATTEEAAGFCEALADGATTLEEIQARYDAEDAERERRAIKAATEQAKDFRDKLEGLGISYTALLDLMDQQMNLGELAHRILLGYERGEGFPNA